MNREFTEADYQRAIAYPWERPRGSYLFRAGEVVGLDPDSPAPELPGERHALIAIGANGSPRALRRKLGDLTGDDAEVLVLTGELEGYRIAPSAHLAVYGALPATLIAEPGAAAPVAMLLATEAQLEAIGLTEFNYHVVRLPAERFAPELDVTGFADPLAYLSCHGAFAPDGAHLGDLPQTEVLSRASRVVLGENAGGRELVKRTVEDYRWAVETAIPRLGERALAVELSDWEIVSTARAARSR